MSLSRILNDDPSPSRAPYTLQSKALDGPGISIKGLSPSRYNGSSPHTHRIPSPHHEPTSYSPPFGRHVPPPYQAAGEWDPYAREWVRDRVLPSEPPGYLYAGRTSDSQRSFSPQDTREHSTDAYNNEGEDEDTPSRRRRKDEDSDYQPPGQRRVSPRKPPSRSKIQRPSSPGGELMETEVRAQGQQQRLSEQESRLASSDLEDCEEVWIGELGDYILETQKRLKEVEKWFEASVLERNSTVADHMSHHYARRIARIPLPAPDSPIYMPSEHYSSRSDHIYNHGELDPPDTVGRGMDGGGDSPNGVGIPSPGLRKGKGKEISKRPASDGSSDFDVPLPMRKDRAAPASKRRRLDDTAPDIADELELSIVGAPSYTFPAVKVSGSSRSKGKGKQLSQREGSPDSVSAAPKRRRGGPRKKLDTLLPPDAFGHLGLAPASASASGDATPSASRPASPALPASGVVFELDELIPPLKKAKKVDDVAMSKRIKLLEDAQRKVWTNIARRDVAKVYKYHAMGYQSRQSQLERIAKLASLQARKPFTRTPKANKDVQTKAKRLMREMQVFWKKNEKEERDVRKREQKEALDRAKVEEEKREAARQARKLEFLISQTELYSHFVGNKLKTAEVEGEPDSGAVPAGADVGDVDPDSLKEINFDDDDPTNLHRHAKHNAEEAIALAKQRAQQFDAQAALERKTNEALKLAKAQAHLHEDSEEQLEGVAPLVDLDSDELNFQNPSSLSGPLTVRQPKMLMAQLKEYQLKGLNWLATLYEQGINGILADEMGLGKTVQSISLLAYLAETHDIWGPFLVVAPASTLHNWQQELTRFVPGLKALPYWGNVKDRTTLRKFWSKKEISYNQDAPFHVLITSYQLVTQDQQYFQRVKWQYMILDEAQNIKNSSSVRWKTLLGFQCRNRLLLTGTPIQNSMQELWALLHFIMPSLFDSHDEFNEWFSKDIENAAENKGSKLNEHQLRRLHMILKPFMLRRVKRHVQNELSDKIEKDIYVDLSARQRALYKALLANVSVADLLEKAANIGDADSARSLMNLVMQFRKVCNHPELFERADVIAPFSFARFSRSGSIMREGDFIPLAYSTRNPIEFSIPELFYHDGGLVDVPSEYSTNPKHSICLQKLMNIWSTDWIHRSLYDEVSSSFSFLRLLDMSPTEAHSLHVAPLIRRQLLAAHEEAACLDEAPYYLDATFAASATVSPLRLSTPLLLCSETVDGLPDLRSIALSTWTESCLSRPELKWFVPPAVAPSISLYCRDRSFLEHQAQIFEAPLESLALYGLPPALRESEEACAIYQKNVLGLSSAGLFGTSPANQLPLSTMQVPEAKRLIYDSAKLARLDALLQELKAGDHRVLVYFQMTRMMDLMEEYLVYRQYKYLRLDGSSKLEDRRDMVIDWQTRPDYFVFLLSTRAGGLGINLTAADTVVFYDHDWNPSNDAQAMDRAHRLGQTRQVTVYRLITRGTIDERIVQLARVKKDVQDIVVGNKNFTDVTKPSEIVQLLLNDEQLASLGTSAPGLSTSATAGTTADGTDEPARDLWNEEGDDFFGHSGGASASAAVELAEDENGTPGPSASRNKKRKTGAAGAPRVRKSTAPKRKSANATPAAERG